MGIESGGSVNCQQGLDAGACRRYAPIGKLGTQLGEEKTMLDRWVYGSVTVRCVVRYLPGS
jgi:hypothetical protein